MINFFNYLEEEEITPNSFYVLWCIYEKCRPVITNSHTELRNLINTECITKEYVITEKGANILKKAIETFNMETSKKPILVSSVLETKVDQYLTLFPKGKLPSGKSARANKKDVIKAFKWFFDNYDYSWDVILKATAYYVDSFEQNGFKFMRNAHYFIGKTNPDKTKESDLASYCDLVNSGDDLSNDNHIEEKVV